ncbi:MAG TPA: PIG-L family deacetylase [Anaerolineae bacterium]|nr:PIG-L family deacetylase [Anaerolineae bacterium]
MANVHSKPDDTLRVLVVLAHPDDPEFFCGGTVARWSSEGNRISYCLLTHGERGADGCEIDLQELAQRRRLEQQAAADLLGVEQVVFLDHPDGYLLPNLELRKDVTRVLRQIRPHTVITSDPTNYFPGRLRINHPDHRAAGEAVLAAVFPAVRSSLYFPELETQEGLKPHKVQTVFVAGAQHPNTTIDVTEFMHLKLAAIAEHASQIDDLHALHERVRKRMLDEGADAQMPRYVERFLRIDLK